MYLFSTSGFTSSFLLIRNSGASRKVMLSRYLAAIQSWTVRLIPEPGNSSIPLNVKVCRKSMLPMKKKATPMNIRYPFSSRDLDFHTIRNITYAT
ncbi:hypothetical protein DSECCO2_498910 [anaerobic digester metagenome]